MNRALAVFGFCIAAAYCPFIEGAATTPRWLLLALVVPITLFVTYLAGRTVPMTVAHRVGAIFIGWACLSLLWTETPYDSVDALWPLLLLAGCFALGSMIEDSAPLIEGMAWGVGISSALVLVEYASGNYPFGWTIGKWLNIPAFTPYAGLFGNKNYLAEAAALVLVGLCTRQWGAPARIWSPVRFWALVACVVPSLAITGSRSALMAIAVVLVVSSWRSRIRWAVVGGVMFLGFVVFLVFPGSASVVDRWHIWADAFRGMNLIGHGLGSFGGTISQFMHDLDPMAVCNVYAHNELVQISYELGEPGLIVALAFVFEVMFSYRSERFIVLAFLVEAFSGFPSHLPITGALAAAMAGCAARDLPRICIPSYLGGGGLHARGHVPSGRQG